MISIQEVSKRYAPKKKAAVQAVDCVSMDVARGEFLIITGRSGSGKTTLLNLVAGLARPSSGRVLLDDIEVWQLPDDRQAALRNRKIGFVFQFPSLMPSLNALENVLLPTAFGHNGHTDSELRQRAEALLVEVGLADKLDALPRQLSAGQQQRVVIARALVHEPELLLADEPTSNLDEQTEAEIMQLFKTIHASRNITILLVTHTRELISYGTQALHMANGRFVE